MKFDRINSFKLINMVLLVLSLLLTAGAGEEAGRCVARDVYFVAPQLNGGQYAFTADDIRALERDDAFLRFAYSSLDSGWVSRGEYTVYGRLLYTGQDFFSLNNLRFRSGGPWSGESDSGVVLNASLAWQLFGSLDVVGQTLELAGKTRSVLGVTDQKKLSPDSGCAYLPWQADRGEVEINGLLVQSFGYRPQDGQAFLTAWLGERGRARQDYYVTDMNRYLAQVRLKTRILGLLIGCYIALSLMQIAYRFLRQSLAQKRLMIGVALFGAALLLAGATVLLLYRGLLTDQWVPHSGGSRWVDVFRAVTNQGMLPELNDLSENLAALRCCNSRANVGLFLGVGAFLNLLWMPGFGRQREVLPERSEGEDRAGTPGESLASETE